MSDTIKFKFIKDYKQFKKGMYLEVPNKRYTGQTKLKIIYKELEEILKNKIIKQIKQDV